MPASNVNGCRLLPSGWSDIGCGITRWSREMTLDAFSAFIRSHYELVETHHATAILENDFPDEWKDLVNVLTAFRLRRSDITKSGGRKSPVAHALDSQFYARGWEEKSFDTKVLVDQAEYNSPTHKVDCYKNKVAVEVEWNNKDPFYDRDLNNFRLLFELRTMSVGVLITRADELQRVFDDLGRGASFGASTTHMGKLLPRLEGGGGGGCPILAVGIKRDLYVGD